MTEQELALYRKCTRKKRIRTRTDYEDVHNYDIETNNITYEKE